MVAVVLKVAMGVAVMEVEVMEVEVMEVEVVAVAEVEVMAVIAVVRRGEKQRWLPKRRAAWRASGSTASPHPTPCSPWCT